MFCNLILFHLNIDYFLSSIFMCYCWVKVRTIVKHFHCTVCEKYLCIKITFSFFLVHWWIGDIKKYIIEHFCDIFFFLFFLSDISINLKCEGCIWWQIGVCLWCTNVTSPLVLWSKESAKKFEIWFRIGLILLPSY